MNDNLSRAGKTILIVLITVSALSIAVHLAKPQIVYIPDPNYIPSVMAIQQNLKALDDPRYDPGPIDGIPGPNTITGWDNYTKDQHAKRAIEGE